MKSEDKTDTTVKESEGLELATTAEQTGEVKPDNNTSQNVTEDILSLVHLGSSLIFHVWSTVLQTAMTVAFAGTIGTAEQAGVGLAISFFDVTADGIGIGLATASDTLLSQAYASPFTKMVGVFLQRGIVFFVLTFLIVSVVNMNSDILFTALGQDLVTVCIARRFLTLITPGILLYYLNRLIVVFFRIQNAYWPIIVASTIRVVSTGLACYVLVIQLHQGVDGVAHANNISYVTTFTAMTIYALVSRIYAKTWGGWSIKVFDGWWSYCKLGCASTVLLTTEYLFLSILTFLAGTLGPVALSTQAIGFQLYLSCGSFILAFALACGVRTGHYLGAKEPMRARRTVLHSTCISIALVVVLVGVVIFFRHDVASLFTSDRETRETTANVLIYCMLCNLVEAVYQNLNGSLRGAARQVTACVINIISMYGIGLPVLLTLKFTNTLTLPNSWLTFAGTEVLISLVFSLVLLKTDWTAQVRLAYERVRSDGHQGQKEEQNEKTPIVEDIDGDESKIVIWNIIMKVTILIVVSVSAITTCLWAVIVRPVLPVGTSSQNFTDMATCLSLNVPKHTEN